MAQITWGIGLAAKVQAVDGTPEVFATGGALTLAADGIVLGDAGSGIGESGIDFALERIDSAVAPITSSFTAQFPSFVRREVAKLSITVQAKGSGRTSSNPTVDADFDVSTHYPGLNALLRSAGLTGSAWGTGVGHSYVPASAANITVKIWVGTGTGAVLYIIYDCTAKLTMALTPGEIALWTFEIEGTLSSHDATVTLPTFAYSTVSTTSAPVLASAAHSFGIGAAARGFSDMTITLDNRIEEVPDSNAVGGITKRQTARDVSLSATLYADTGDEDYEDTLLAATVATTDDVTFVVGAATAISSAAVDWRINFNNPNLKSQEVAKLGPSVARTIELQATATSANAEFELIFY
jgi:hypothetical protein